MIFVITTFRHVNAADAVVEFDFHQEPCLDVIMPKIFRLLYSTIRNSFSMGVKCGVYYLMFTTDHEVDFLLLHESQYLQFIECAISAPDGVAPEAIFKFLFEYRVNTYSSPMYNLQPI
jgi:hypothetical protein